MKNSILKTVLGIITNNFGLKLLAVIVSCGLWFAVNSINDPVRSKPFNNISVDIINAELVTNENKVYEVLDGTDTVNVTVTGKNSVLSTITRDDIRAVADMSELTFMNTVGIKVSSVRYNSELDFKTSIDNVKLSIEGRRSVQKPIGKSTTGEPAEGYVVGSIDTSQNVVRLSGPESLIDQVDHIDAVVNIEGYSSDINTNVDLKLYDAANNEIKSSAIKMNISSVNVTVTILATKEVPLGFVIPDTPAEGYVVSEDIVSFPEKVVIAGRSSILDGISRISISDPALGVDGLRESMTTIINIRKYLPSGAQFADSSFSGNVSVTVGIEPLVTKELDIPAKNFAAAYKPEDYRLTLREVEDQEYYRIRIRGTKAAVDVVDAEGVIGVVDMDQLLEELGLSEWGAGVFQGEIRFNIPDNVTLEQPYRMTVELAEIEEENGEDDNGDGNGNPVNE